MYDFSENWPDFSDYIIEITRIIWDRRDVLALHDYYGQDIVVRTPGGLTVGVDAVIQATYEMIGRAPRRSSGAEDVIWSRNDDGHYYSSHRVCDVMHHVEDDMYGKATGRSVWYWIIADCAARNDVIDDEWLFRDTGGLVRQLGWDPREFARHQIVTEGGPANCIKPLTPAIDVPGPYVGTGNDNEWGIKYAAVLTRVMEGDLGAILDEYDEQCHSAYAGAVQGHSHDDINKFWARLRSSFPNARFTIHHTIGRHDDLLSPRAAIRWSIEGKHKGWGAFGKPSGADVYVLGVSHVEFGPRGIRREYALYDQVAVWKQILMQTETE